MTRLKLRKIFSKSQSKFSHYVKKIEAQANKWFSFKKMIVCYSEFLELAGNYKGYQSTVGDLMLL